MKDYVVKGGVQKVKFIWLLAPPYYYGKVISVAGERFPRAWLCLASAPSSSSRFAFSVEVFVTSPSKSPSQFGANQSPQPFEKPPRRSYPRSCGVSDQQDVGNKGVATGRGEFSLCTFVTLIPQESSPSTVYVNLKVALTPFW